MEVLEKIKGFLGVATGETKTFLEKLISKIEKGEVDVKEVELEKDNGPKKDDKESCNCAYCCKKKKEMDALTLQFDKSEGFPFEIALFYMKQWREVANKNWNWHGMQIYLQDGFEDDNCMSYLEMKLQNWKVVPYAPSQADMLRWIFVLV